MPDQLVERVVPADVFARGDQLAVGGEARRRVQPAGLVEHPLVRGEPIGQRAHDARGDRRAGADRRAADLHLVERGLAADPARRVREVAALAQVVGNRPPEPHRHDVVLLLGLARPGSVASAARQYAIVSTSAADAMSPSVQQQPDRELEVVAGRAHRRPRTATGSWPGPCTRISIGSSVAS